MIELSEKDKKQLEARGISEAMLEEQLTRFKEGFPFLKIAGPAIVNKGIMALGQSDREKYEKAWADYLGGKHVVTKFVPASGAASRMFKDLFSFLDASYDVPATAFEKEFFENIKEFAFYASLDAKCKANAGKSIEELLASGDYKSVVANLLKDYGLNYGSLPKGLLEFHKDGDKTRTPVEEHLIEGALYANVGQQVNLHFTVSAEHSELFKDLIVKRTGEYQQQYGVKYQIGFSKQKPSTDTIAVNVDNTLFRDNGSLLFRPGGHGALIENLNDIDSDIVFVKNIDNVVPEKKKQTETTYKKILAGVLVDKQKQIFDYLSLLEKADYTHDQLIEMLYFLQSVLNVKHPETKLFEDVELALYIKEKLNRPIRVCGMVKNEGEPGGGPFLVESSDRTIAPQILESSQIDINKIENKESVEKSTHFNPVDLVCAVRNYKGNKFNLINYIDKRTGFISGKSQGGKSLKALELPGLWNGSMSNWNTIFVEVPVETFNPVKTVNDLLRENHL